MAVKIIDVDRIFEKLPCVCTEKGGEECSKGSHKA